MKTLTHIVTPEEEGRLIKRLLRGEMGLSHRQFSRVKAASGLLVNGVPVHADYRVSPGETVSVTLVESDPSLAQPEDLPAPIVYEDEDLLIADKPAPLACQSSVRQSGGSLENRLVRYFEGSPFVFRPVNRLDKGTSGLMVVAKNAHAQAKLTLQLHTPDFLREYLAVTEGCPQPPRGVIDLPIAKAAGATIRREVCPQGKSARTHYETLETAGNRALVRLRLETGRTHQIRVHLSALGCPVCGDFLYGSELETLPGRFALHSARLSLLHPETGRLLEFRSPLPPALAALLSQGQGS